ncbi:uncharacterized protein UTRI_06451 [Ustilago trichophora]|uniref:Uncharacterized protein n=1 Tax=Ustilago trichophora TaxID=86804 RepID=A0A5C3ELW6_9BASI|nr:uncharacterized protein UTRI_06451 [Ustilago trichophora]
MSNQASELYHQIQELQLKKNNAIDLLGKFDSIRHALQQLGYVRDDYSLVEEFLQKFDGQQDFSQAVHFSCWDTYEGMRETFIATQKKIEAEWKARNDLEAEMALAIESTGSLKME